jgi:aspartyl protease family protein
VVRWYLVFIVLAAAVSSMFGGMQPASQPGGGLSAPGNVAESEAQAAPEASLASLSADASDGSVRIERSANGHFYADVQINGATVNLLVDTGASGIALSREDARTAGLATSIGMPNVIGRGADGEVRGEFVTLDSVSLGGKTVAGTGAMVLNSGEQSLLGQTFLSKFESVEIRGDTMVLR